MRGGIDPGDYCFRSRSVGFVDAWKDFSSGDGTLSFSGVEGPKHRPEPQLSPHAGFMSSSQSAISRWDGVSIPGRAVSTRGIAVFASGYWRSRLLKGL